MTNNIPKSLLPHLNEIASRLWSGHAAIMVGAGFSKNATPKSESCKSFPDWNSLGDLFYERTRGDSVSNSNGRYLNVLKLADEVQATLGRPMLHQLLRESIPDEEYEPSELHVKLLDLPWTDVLTTNYDTLLERARKSVTKNKFDIVEKKEDLIYSEKPRIIKLHGSFPNVEPFIITEEDYRRYPDDFAPFVNTVQQTLLENTLCLIGFSGDDPNFLSWIGWIRDNLGDKQSPKIYLLGVLNLSKAQESLLVQYNIVAIDMSGLLSVGQDHYKGIDAFFDFCLSKKEESDRLDWPSIKSPLAPSLNNPDKSKQDQIRNIIPIWREQRLSYPGWVVVPDDRRNNLWRYTELWDGYVEKANELSSFDLLEFVFEFLWRLEKSLCPIYDNNIPLITSVLDLFLPCFTETGYKIPSELANDIRAQRFESWQVNNACSFILLSLMRYYREEGQLGKWKEYEAKAVVFLSNQDDLARLSYERVLYHLFELEYLSANRELDCWKVPETMPFWLAKKAGLLAEVGKPDVALKILESSLKTVRSKLNLMPVTTDYSSVSQESYILVLLRYVKDGLDWKNGIHFTESDFSERWNVLKQYKCDPWNELALLEMPMMSEPVKQSSITITKTFDIGRSRTTRHLGHSNTEALAAFKFLKFIEESGIPYKVPGSTFAKKGAVGAMKRLAGNAPYWMMATMLRMGDSKVVEHIYNRESLSSLPVTEIDCLIQNYIKVYYENVPSGEEGSHNVEGLTRTIPEILSRLCCKCSPELKGKLIDLLLNIYFFDRKANFEGVSNLTSRLIGSLSESEVLQYIPKLIEFPILDGLHTALANEFKNPFFYLQGLDPDLIQLPVSYCLDADRIGLFITHTRSGSIDQRSWSIWVLMTLYRLKILTSEQVTLFVEAVWSKTDETNLPAETEFYKFSFIEDLCPDGVDGHSLIKSYILSHDLPVQKGKAEKGVSMCEGYFPIFNETLGASRHVDWSQEEVVQVFGHYINWWDADKTYLKKQVNSDNVTREFERRFLNISNVFVSALSEKLKLDCEGSRNSLRRLINEMQGFGLPVCSLRCAFLHIFPDDVDSVIESIEHGVASTNNDFIVDSFNGLILILKRGEGADSEVIRAALSMLSNALLFRSRERIVSALNSVCNLLFNCKYALESNLEKKVLFSLSQLVSETAVGSDMFGFSDALNIREASARLAYKLYSYYSLRGLDIPEEILRWKSVCSSEEEFVEIKKNWANN